MSASGIEAVAAEIWVGSTVHRSRTPLRRTRATVYRFLAVAVGPAERGRLLPGPFLSALRAYLHVTAGERLDQWILRIT